MKFLIKHGKTVCPVYIGINDKGSTTRLMLVSSLISSRGYYAVVETGEDQKSERNAEKFEASNQSWV